MYTTLSRHPWGRGAVRDLVRAGVVWTVFVAATTMLWAVLGPQQAAARQETSPAGDAELDGEFLWRRDCASCHGPEGNGTGWGPSLQGKGPADVYLVTTTGRMPIGLPQAADEANFDLQKLGESGYSPNRLEITGGEVEYRPGQIAALVDYSREILAGPDVPVVDVSGADLSHGLELFQLNCAACHRWSARGGALYDGQVATSLADSTPTQVVSAMRVGLGTMPEFSEAVLSDEDAADIAAYVEYLRNPRTEGGNPLAFVGPAAEGFVAWLFGIVVLIGAVRWIGTRT